MSITKKVTTSIIFLSLLSSTAFASPNHQASQKGVGKILVKLRGGYSAMSNSKSKQTNSAITGSKLKGSYLGELAIGYHITEHIAVEGSAGYNKASLKINGATPVSSKVNIIPATALLQYYFVPEATLSPYIGVGYSYQSTFGGAKAVSISNGGGPVGQLGFDILFDDMFGSNTVGLNFDIKYTHDASHNIKLKSNNSKLKQKISTTAAAVGVTFEF